MWRVNIRHSTVCILGKKWKCKSLFQDIRHSSLYIFTYKVKVQVQVLVSGHIALLSDAPLFVYIYVQSESSCFKTHDVNIRHSTFCIYFTYKVKVKALVSGRMTLTYDTPLFVYIYVQSENTGPRFRTNDVYIRHSTVCIYLPTKLK
jgi:hypothetical protein